MESFHELFRIPELAINPLGDRIVHAFFYESKSQGEEKVDFKVKKDSKVFKKCGIFDEIMRRA